MSPPNHFRIGILHPGAMGISVAASARNGGSRVYWAAEDRSAQTAARARAMPLTELETVAELCAQSDLILSVCPPHAAEHVAAQVIANQFHGLYCDANAISPQRARRIGAMLAQAGIDFVDGGIIGGPAQKPGETRLYLAGERAQEVASCFDAGPLQALVIGGEIGKASALKMCYAALSKGSTALLCAVFGAAEALDVRAELYQQWTHDAPDAVKRNETRIISSIAKAWRFEGEMGEIAETFAAAGMPDGFHRAAAEIYHRLAPLKDAPTPVSADDILNALLIH